MLPFLPHEMMRFHDREHAGRVLAERLAPLVRGPCVVAGVARGGVAVAVPVAHELGAPLVPVLGHKLFTPACPELAFGAIDDDGEVLLDDFRVRQLQIDAEEVERVRRATWDRIERCRADYGGLPFKAIAPGRTIVLLDDGAATGLTARAALAYVKRQRPSHVLVAVPCASLFAAEQLEQEAEQLIVITVDAEFHAVTTYYDSFDPVTDEQVRALLNAARLENEFSKSLDPVASG